MELVATSHSKASLASQVARRNSPGPHRLDKTPLEPAEFQQSGDFSLEGAVRLFPSGLSDGTEAAYRLRPVALHGAGQPRWVRLRSSRR